MPTKVLLDTDIDIVGDIDDVMCLTYLLAEPQCELLGITTVTWDTGRRSMVASALCKAAGKDVPIYPGASTPLLVPLPSFDSVQTNDVEAELLTHWDHETTFPRGEAVEFMRRTIRRHPGEVVLLGVGPMTNIALLFATDPEIPQLLKGLVLMAGMFTHRIPGAPLREWNALLDPHASAIVYGATARQHRSIGLDVTYTLKMDAEQVRARLGSNTSSLLHQMLELWFSTRNSIIFHDPLAAMTIFDEQLCRFEKGNIQVELTSERLKGFTHWTPTESNPQHEVAVEVDQERFFEQYFSVVK